jgi:hypothetical protein
MIQEENDVDNTQDLQALLDELLDAKGLDNIRYIKGKKINK